MKELRKIYLNDGDVIRCTACPDHGCTGRPVRVRVVFDPHLPCSLSLFHDGNPLKFGFVIDGVGHTMYGDDIEVIGRRT